MENIVAQGLGLEAAMLMDIALFILRVAIGVCFIVHGLGKLGVVGASDLKGFTGYLQSLGFPLPSLQAKVAMLAELVGGILLVVGLFAQLAAFFLFLTMLLAAFKGHKGGGYLILNNPPGNEYALNLAFVALFFILVGPGKISLDFLFF